MREVPAAEALAQTSLAFTRDDWFDRDCYQQHRALAMPDVGVIFTQQSGCAMPKLGVVPHITGTAILPITPIGRSVRIFN